MNRRRFTMLGLAGTLALAQPTAPSPRRAASQEVRPAILDLIDVEPSLIDELYVRAFQIPANASPVDQLSSLYWIVAMGFVLASEQDVEEVREASFRSVPEWYVAGNGSMRLGEPFEASLGGQTIGDGATAWYWDVENPEDPDEIWQQFGIGCTAVWSDRRLLMLWGCAALENPIRPLFDLASAVHDSWSTSASSLVPELDHVPMGMVVIDDGPVDLGSEDTPPPRPVDHGADLMRPAVANPT